MNNIEFSDVKITGGYWRARQDINCSVTLKAVYDRFNETGRFEALKCDLRDGDTNIPHIFWDSDVAKWIEGASYILHSEKNDQAVEIIENAIDLIIKNSDENGYFNSHFLVAEKENRFRLRECHELYCAGHLIEAAVAYYELTGKDRFLNAVKKYADYIERAFKIDNTAAFITPGHPEIELALVRLYKATGEKRYIELAKYFIDKRGNCDEPGIYTDWANEYYSQDEIPVRERKTAEGHCVRALYLMCAAADIAYIYKDNDLKTACERFFDSIVNKRMYITGGVGSSNMGESFTIDYDLPNRTAYAETCAAISLAMFAERMLKFGADSRYSDIIERTMYNGIMSGISLDGKSFFYENPLEIDPDFNNINTSTKVKERFPITQRVEVFDCSCCPPNIMRFVASISGLIYGFDDNTVYINQYINSEGDVNGIKISQKTDYPNNGKITVRCNSNKKQIAFRIPCWCKSFNINKKYSIKNGYAYVDLDSEENIELELDMPVRIISANRRIHSDAGRIAVMRGPVVYCAEGIDNGADIKSIALPAESVFELAESEFLLPILKTEAYRPFESDSLYYEAVDDYEKIPLTLIPYYAFANRGESEMQVWLLRK
jgi:hypothetical protein